MNKTQFVLLFLGRKGRKVCFGNHFYPKCNMYIGSVLAPEKQQQKTSTKTNEDENVFSHISLPVSV